MARYAQDLYTQCRIARETEKAIAIECYHDTDTVSYRAETVWLPKSQITIERDKPVGDGWFGTYITVPGWLVAKHSLGDYLGLASDLHRHDDVTGRAVGCPNASPLRRDITVVSRDDIAGDLIEAADDLHAFGYYPSDDARPRSRAQVQGFA